MAVTADARPGLDSPAREREVLSIGVETGPRIGVQIHAYSQASGSTPAARRLATAAPPADRTPSAASRRAADLGAVEYLSGKHAAERPTGQAGLTRIGCALKSATRCGFGFPAFTTDKRWSSIRCTTSSELVEKRFRHAQVGGRKTFCETRVHARDQLRSVLDAAVGALQSAYTCGNSQLPR